MRGLELYNTPIAAQVAVQMVAGCLDGCTCGVQTQFTVQTAGNQIFIVTVG